MTRIHLGQRIVLLDAHTVESPTGTETLTPLEASLLRCLAQGSGPVSQQTLLTEVWGYHPDLQTRAVHHAVTRLRRKLEDDPSNPTYLKTVRGLGYVLDIPEAPNAPARQPASTLFGRESDLQGLDTATTSPGLFTLTGPGGVGKTCLLTHWLDQSERSHLFCDLSLCETLPSMASEVCRALGIQSTTDCRALARALAGQDTRVLALDNLEQGLDAARELIRGLREAAPDVTIVTTSRVALQLRDEVAWPVPCLPLPVGHGLRDAANSPAFALFLDRVKRVLPTFEATDDSLPALLDVLAAVDGHPLALELAAPRTRVLSLSDLAGRLRNDIRLLRARQTDVEPRHQTLSGVLQSSVDALDPESQRLFAQLSCFAGSFDMAAAEAITGVDVALALETLVEHSLLVASDGRLRMLVPVRAFARDQLALDPDLQAETVQRHRLHYAKRGTTDALRAAECSTDLAHALVDDRHDLLTACRKSIAADDPTAAVQALSAATEGFRAGAEHALCLQLADEVLAMPTLSDDQRMHALIIAVVGLQQTGQRDAALQRLLVAGPCADPELDATRHRLLGEFHHEHGHPEKSAAAFDKALALTSDPAFEWTTAEIVGNAARCAAERGQTEQALQGYTRCLNQFNVWGRHARLAPVATNFANLHRDLGDEAQATYWYDRAMRSAAASGSQRVEAVARCNRAALDTDFGRYQAALRGFDQGLAQLHRIGDTHYEGIFLGLSSELHTAMGDLERARDAAVGALACHNSLDDTLWSHVARGRIAVVDRIAGRLDTAIAELEALLPLLETPLLQGYALFLGELAQARAQAGDLDAARRDFDRAEALFGEHHWDPLLAFLLAGEARLLATSHPERARHALTKADALRVTLHRPETSRLGLAIHAAREALDATSTTA